MSKIEQQSQYPRHYQERLTRYPFKELTRQAEILPSGILISTMPGEVSVSHRVFMAQMVSAKMGSAILTYPNIPVKAVHESLLQAEVPDVPQYVNSCPEIDDMLLGRHADMRTEPNYQGDTYYFDVSRAGIYGAFNRSLGYVSHAEKKVRSSNDPNTQKWIENYGVGVCAPLISFSRLAEYAEANNADSYAIPVTSIAESLQVVAAMFPLATLDIMKILESDSWIGGNGSTRAKKSARLFESLSKHIRETEGIDALNNLIFGQAGLEKLVSSYMSNVEANFYLGKDKDEITQSFIERTIHSRSPHCHPNNGHQADVSEIVVRSKGKALSPIPWEAMVILGDGHSSLDQLTKTAELIKQAQPDMNIVIICAHTGQPLELDHVEGMVPTLAEYAVMGWSNHFLGQKCARMFK
ncbi:MAG: hypothetical protein GW941_00695 [Candidatus Pacebacteria bacterium]|nr:hypothetical protein [Candidatus Paceibacterota bacterium]